jgi:putative Holliday junction resolvase
MPPTPKSVLALDVGGRRIGVAVASMAARLPRPLTTLINDATFVDRLAAIIKAEDVGELVIGLPRNLAGQNTAQTKQVETFARELNQHFNLPLHWQDEAVTSAQAEAELKDRGQTYAKADIDALAAVYILQDWLSNQEVKR